MSVAKTPAEAAIEDVSERFADLNPCDRIFSSASGYLVKVKTHRVRRDEDPSSLHFRLQGALCGDDGKAQFLNGVPFVGAPHAFTVHPNSAVDPAAALAAERALIVRRMEQAALHHAAAQALQGVGDAG